MSEISSQKNNMVLMVKNNPLKSFIVSQKAQKITAYSIFALLIQILCFLLFFRDSSKRWNEAATAPPVEESHLEEEESCRYGKVFVHDLPPMFNKELLDKCEELNPWVSRCKAVSNGGFGPKAACGGGEDVPENLASNWYWTDMYNGEVIYHLRMLNYTCRTMDPLEASAFYIPFYAAISYGKYFVSSYVERDRHSEMVLDWVKDQPSWRRRNGSDHFIMLGSIPWDFRRRSKDDTAWGTSFVLMPLMKNVFRLSIEKVPWENDDDDDDDDELEVSVPYPTSFHPETENDVSEWQGFVRAHKRNSLFCFVGAERKKIQNDFRGLLMKQCKRENETCRVLDCSKTSCYDGDAGVLEAHLNSDFCLQPRGEGFTRRSFFDCMLAGSIPVYFWKESFVGQYEWHLPLMESSSNFSVFIDRNDVRNGKKIIREVLQGFSREDVRKMKENVIEMIPRILYAFPTQGLGNTKDAFDISIEGVLKRMMSRVGHVTETGTHRTPHKTRRRTRHKSRHHQVELEFSKNLNTRIIHDIQKHGRNY